MNSSASSAIEGRISDLVRHMSLDEKVAQLCCVRTRNFIDADGRFDPSKAEPLLRHGAGSCDPVRLPIPQEVEFRNAMQRYLRERTPHGIPVLFHEEGCHGVLAPQATSFPVPAAFACSWDVDLVERLFAVIGAELRARGVHHALTPVIDTSFDPRWGRTDEMMGEDPFLNTALGVAIVRGLQGDDPTSIGEGKVAATLKHLAGHGAPEAGVNRAPAHLGPRELRELHLAPFRDVIARARPATVMPSYNEIDGLPSHANRWLLQDVLRGEFGFDGLVVSDYHGVRELFKCHHVASDDPGAAARAFNAGVDTDLPMGEHYALLPTLVREGRIAESAIDDAVARVLRLKFAVGLFEGAAADADEAWRIVNLDSTKTLAREAAQKSIVLLKNAGGILPLAKDLCGTVAVIGPHADDTRLGGYSGEPLYRVNILKGIEAHIGNAARVVHARGCLLTTNEGEPRHSWEKVRQQEFPSPEENRALIAQAVELARTSDLVVLVLGENELVCREAWAADHIGDRASLDLFGAQNELADAIFGLGKPVVVYLMNGRPLAIPHIIERADAVLEGWYLGQETGHAAADILFGEVNPSGKLTMTVPRSVGQVPIYYNQKPSARGYRYLDLDNTPLFPFGFGLSYTTFSYGEPRLSFPEMSANGRVEVALEITNTGEQRGTEVVQLYVGDKVASVTRPVKELKGFSRIDLAPGESATVRFSITPDLLSFYDEELRYVVESGEFDIMVGPSSAQGRTVTLTVGAAANERRNF